jgi:hypothetical protein
VTKENGQVEVLYNVPKFKEYGKLSKVNLDQQQHGIRVEVDANKKSPHDFVLWKPAKAEEGWSWDSPWGKGRPGWHIECSAMAKKHLGDTIDLHHGGVDLQFPHHENEIAQSEAANGCVFCNNWAHNEFLNFGSEKMSKSLGNCIYLSEEPEDIEKKVKSMFIDPNHLRVQDPGKVEGNPVFIYLDAFCRPEHFAEFWPEYQNLDEVKAHYQRGGLGDVKVKKFLNSVMQAELEPIRNRRKEWEQRLPEVVEILKEGSDRAREFASAKMRDVRKKIGVGFR